VITSVYVPTFEGKGDLGPGVLTGTHGGGVAGRHPPLAERFADLSGEFGESLRTEAVKPP